VLVQGITGNKVDEQHMIRQQARLCKEIWLPVSRKYNGSILAGKQRHKNNHVNDTGITT
jgi:hypothetical protein